MVWTISAERGGSGSTADKPGLQRQVDRRRGLRAVGYPRNVPTLRGEDDPGLPAVAFQPRKDRKRAGPR